MSAPIRVAVVGCGAHAAVHGRTIAAEPRLALTACCDPDGARAARFAAAHGGAPHEELAAMLAAARPEAVVLCTWPNLHLAQLRTCLGAGVKHVLCEKPLATSGADALETLRLARAHGARVVEGYMYRHHPAQRKVEELVLRSGLGPVDVIHAAFSNYEPEAHADALQGRDWRYRAECGGGVAHDWLAYCVDGANRLAGARPRRVFASGRVHPEYGVVDRLYGHVEYANGVVGVVESSKHASFTQQLSVACARGIVRLPVAWGIYGEVTVERLHRKQKWDYILADAHRIEEADAFALQLADFVDAVQGRSSPRVSLEESVVNAITTDALLTSVREGRAVEPDFAGLDAIAGR